MRASTVPAAVASPTTRRRNESTGTTATVPQHVAVIMDGNRRWASSKGLPSAAGHRAGAQALRHAVESCAKNGVAALTVFAFSSENWRRDPNEVRALLSMMASTLRKEAPRLRREGVRLHVVGSSHRLPVRLREALQEAQRETRENDRLLLTVALDYGGRQEITAAARAAAEMVQRGDILPSDIDEALLDALVCARAAPEGAQYPPLDLLVRTSGEQRISNFMLWHMAYTELYFTNVLWPDFGPKEMDAALQYFRERKRRFGGG